MNPDVVVDVGNTRIKWGRCTPLAVAEVAALPPDEPEAWLAQLTHWGLSGPSRWAVAGVHPARRDRLMAWLLERGAEVHLFEFARQLPLRVALEHPDWVGIDRLFDGVAANARRRRGVAAVVIDAGSAVTANFVDKDGAFRGGAIFPGVRLMAKALHDYTALLPLVEVGEPGPAVGVSTRAAMQVGIFWAVLGGVEALLRQYRAAEGELDVFFTGGDAPMLAAHTREPAHLWPGMTLEGLRLSAAALSGGAAG